jgi:hypothetical protein
MRFKFSLVALAVILLFLLLIDLFNRLVYGERIFSFFDIILIFVTLALAYMLFEIIGRRR